MANNLAHSPVNDQRYDDMLKEVKNFGRDAAAGGDSLPKLAHRVVRAAADGVLDTIKDVDGRDHAAKIYATYVEEQSKKAVHAHSEGGTKANVSKVRKLIEFGCMPIIDPVDVMNHAHSVREELRKAGEKLRPTYASYVEVARAQLELPGVQLTDDELKAIVRKPEKEEKTLAQELEAIHKRIERVISGDGGLKDQSPEIIQAEELFRTRLAAMMVETSDSFYAEFTAGANANGGEGGEAAWQQADATADLAEAA